MTRTLPIAPDVFGLRRPGIVYGINTLDPATGRVVLGYVGQTFQQLWQREAQHREDQPWSDLIVGRAFVIATGDWTQADLDRAERAYIRALRPVYNHDHNLDNPRRVEIWRAREQRWERDRNAGRSPWMPPEQRVAAARPVRVRKPARRRYRWPKPVVRARRRVAARVDRALRLAGVWLAATVGLFVFALVIVGMPAGIAASGSPVAALLLALWMQPARRRRRSRK